MALLLLFCTILLSTWGTASDGCDVCLEKYIRTSILLELCKDFYQFGVKRDLPPSFGATAFLSRLERDPPFFKIHITPRYVPAGSNSAHGIFHKKQVRPLFGRGGLQDFEEIRLPAEYILACRLLETAAGT